MKPKLVRFKKFNQIKITCKYVSVYESYLEIQVFKASYFLKFLRAEISISVTRV